MNKKSFPKWGVIGGALTMAAWGAAIMWSGPFNPIKFVLTVFAVALFAFVAFVFGFVPALMAKQEADWFQKLLCLLLGLAVNGGLIWFVFFR